MTCGECSCEIIDPAAPGVGFRITGIQVKGRGESRKGGSDIIGRELTGEAVCAGCVKSIKQKLPTGQGSLLDEVEERIPPLCDSCHAEVTWATLAKSGKRMPLDRRPLSGTPRARLVVFNPQRQTAVVLNKAQAAEEAPAWLAAGAELRQSHYATCTSAARHRKAA